MGKIDLTGKRFGRLVVLDEAGQDAHKRFLWRCKCDCGNECIMRSNDLRTGNTKSCGCYKRDSFIVLSTKHGMSRSSLYRVWGDMMHRCGVWKGANDRTRRYYAERDITVCEEWKNFENFGNWALSHGYEKGLQIDRIDNDRGYCPANCRWVTPKQNSRNRRNTARLSDGTLLIEFAEHHGVPTRLNNRKTRPYHRVITAFSKYGEDVAVAQVWGEAISLHFSEYGVSFVPFSKISILA